MNAQNINVPQKEIKADQKEPLVVDWDADYLLGMLEMYTDLDREHFQLLQLADMKLLDKNKFNFKYHRGLNDAINPDGSLSPYGAKLLARARDIMAGNIPDRQEIMVISCELVARDLRKKAETSWITSKYVEILLCLFSQPGLSIGYLARQYGYGYMGELTARSIIKSRLLYGYPCRLTPDGYELAWRILEGEW